MKPAATPPTTSAAAAPVPVAAPASQASVSTGTRPRPPWMMDAIAAAAVVAVTLGAYAIEVGPALDRRTSHADDAALLAEHEAKAAQLATIADHLRHQLDPAGAGAAAEVRLEPASALNGRLAALTDLAVAHALQLDAVEPGKETAGATHGTVEIRLAGRGGYRDVAAFVHDARGRIPDTGFTDLAMTSPINPADPATFTVKLVWHTAGRVTGPAN